MPAELDIVDSSAADGLEHYLGEVVAVGSVGEAVVVDFVGVELDCFVAADEFVDYFVEDFVAHDSVGAHCDELEERVVGIVVADMVVAPRWDDIEEFHWDVALDSYPVR